MDTGLYRIEWTGFSGLAKLGGGFPGAPEETGSRFKPVSVFIWLPLAIIAGLGAWMLLSGYASKTAESEPVRPAAATVAEPAPAPATANAPTDFTFNPATAEAIVPIEAAPVDGLRISSQSWRRGGLGSKALVTFTLRNGNDYSVKDIEIFCSFARRDGSHLTDRKRMINDTVKMKGRKTFARMHIGFVNVNANRAKCVPVAAHHI